MQSIISSRSEGRVCVSTERASLIDLVQVGRVLLQGKLFVSTGAYAVSVFKQEL